MFTSIPSDYERASSLWHKLKGVPFVNEDCSSLLPVSEPLRKMISLLAIFHVLAVTAILCIRYGFIP